MPGVVPGMRNAKAALIGLIHLRTVRLDFGIG
jgi:hypothetical protein